MKENRKELRVKLPEHLHMQLQEYAEDAGYTLSSFVLTLLRAGCRNWDPDVKHGKRRRLKAETQQEATATEWPSGYPKDWRCANTECTWSYSHDPLDHKSISQSDVNAFINGVRDYVKTT